MLNFCRATREAVEQKRITARRAQTEQTVCEKLQRRRKRDRSFDEKRALQFLQVTNLVRDEDCRTCTMAPFTRVTKMLNPGAQAEGVMFACVPKHEDDEEDDMCHEAAESGAKGLMRECARGCEGDIISIKQLSCDDLTERFQQEIVEIDVHMFLTQQLVLTGKTPNVSMCFGGRLCPKKRSRKKGMVVGFFERYDMDLATWHSGPKPGRDYTTIRRTEQQWWSALFQILHGLRAIHRLKIMHGDHHDENVLVRRVPRNSCIVYTDVGKTIRVPTHGYMFATYDFGNASARRSDSLRKAHVRYGDNNKRFHRSTYRFRPDFDIVKLFYWLAIDENESPGYDGRVPRSVQQFLVRVIDSKDPATGRQVESVIPMRDFRSYSRSNGRMDSNYLELDHVNRRTKRKTNAYIINRVASNADALLRYVATKIQPATARATVIGTYPTPRPLVPVRSQQYIPRSIAERCGKKAKRKRHSRTGD